MTRPDFLKGSSTSIIILESSPYWEAELRRRIDDLDDRLIICRNLSEVRPAMKSAHDNIFLCPLSPLTGELLLLLSEVQERRMSSGIIVVRKNVDAELDWNLREIGVTAVLPDRYESANEIERYCRILAKSPASVRPVR